MQKLVTLQTKFTNPHIYFWTKGIYSMSFEFERERERERERGVFYFKGYVRKF